MLFQLARTLHRCKLLQNALTRALGKRKLTSVTASTTSRATFHLANKKKVRKPQEEWYRVKNTYEAIISEEVFQKVQELIVQTVENAEMVQHRFPQD